MEKVDLSALRDLTLGDTEFMKDLIETILKSVPKELHLLEDKIASADFESQAKILHKLKPSVEYLGIHSLAMQRRKLHEKTSTKTPIFSDYSAFKSRVENALQNLAEQKEQIH
ncbi:hypothetical protein [Roseivirga pacifica]|uniref:hypothetical protein n=1 Tax=Roseivirga pacifica TaxID=1267423 RepID=UPI0020959D25|nr:hypothetical protein [Roseivirga pacifica]MCO6359231.1 hypothetical protein [Roseivirga pacifica]MCO6365133.1 hypothetical protein [Roseivirga pacifica]MCO6372137.1 hypothetical protein [Roseivirga pacifica]MCO6375752.1 hypothetical protein [Roseivirga pacifica]MCO6379515.1 hypothetical protein [Roseivirga pacifica]